MTDHEITFIENFTQEYFTSTETDELKGVVIHDGVCGMGKTHGMIEYLVDVLKNNSSNRYIYISPFLNELKRVGEELSATPFYEPKQLGEGKQKNLRDLIKDNKNILTTHSLFSQFDNETIRLIQDRRYHLIIDEEPTVMQIVRSESTENSNLKKPEKGGGDKISPFNSQEITTFIENGTFLIDPITNVVRWNKNGCREYTRYSDIKRGCENENLIMYSNIGQPVLIWRLNPEVFRCFKSVQILTYLFKGGMLNAYLDLYSIPYLIRDKTREEIFTNKKIYPYHKLIHFHQYKGEWLSEDRTTLSLSWYNKASEEEKKIIRNKTTSFFKTPNPFQDTKVKSENRLWTVYKDYLYKIRGLGYTKRFLAFSAKSTNNYNMVNKMAYLVNVHINPVVFNYFKMKGVSIDEKNYSLSMLIQWLFRGAIREGKNIHLFMASKRMRELLESWMKDFGEEYDFCWGVVESYKEGTINQYQNAELVQMSFEQYIQVKQPGLRNVLKDYTPAT